MCKKQEVISTFYKIVKMFLPRELLIQSAKTRNSDHGEIFEVQHEIQILGQHCT